MVAGEAGLRALDPGGLEVLDTDLERFAAALTSANHTLKRALSDPRLFSGIGNAYSDEILFEARLSPLALTQKLSREEIERLFAATRATLTRWVDRLREEAGDGFPEKVTAFREGMAVHGRYKQACPRCGAKIQRIRYAANETNYCPKCQTNGKLLADRALSRLAARRLAEDSGRTRIAYRALGKITLRSLRRKSRSRVSNVPIFILGERVCEAVSQVEWIAQARARRDFRVPFSRWNQPDRRSLDGIANLLVGSGLPVLHQNQYFGVIHRTHGQIAGIRLEVVEYPRAALLIEEHGQKRRGIYDHRSSSPRNRGLGLSGAFNPSPSQER